VSQITKQNGTYFGKMPRDIGVGNDVSGSPLPGEILRSRFGQQPTAEDFPT
jgi:hypothetical protein